MFSNIQVCPILMVLEEGNVQTALDDCLSDGEVPIIRVKGEEKKELIDIITSTNPTFKEKGIKELFLCIRFRENYFV